MVCKPKRHGWLRVTNLRIQNEALVIKFLHKFYNKKYVPWVHLLWEAYYTKKIPHAPDAIGSFWWCDVLKLTLKY